MTPRESRSISDGSFKKIEAKRFCSSRRRALIVARHNVLCVSASTCD